jgi:tetratricopeptide (TPR) repeat protein
MSVVQLISAGQQHHAAGNLAAAEQCYRQAQQLQPSNPQVLYLLGMVALARGEGNDAVELLGRALHIHPTERAIRVQLAQALQRADRPIEALALARSIAASDPPGADGHYHLASILCAQDRMDEALAAAERSLERRPDGIDELLLLCELYPALGRWDDARDIAERAARAHPRLAETQWNHALACLLHGDMSRGWEAFQHRPHLSAPSGFELWTRQDLGGKTIVLYCEGGFGDAIQFVRYAPLVQARAKRTILMCPAELLELFKQIPADQLISQDQPVPACDYVCPLQSLPYNFSTTLETIPRDVPYLRADRQRAGSWRNAIRAGDRKVGLAWAGSMTANPQRSRNILTFAPLANVAGVTFYSLQKGPESWQAAAAPKGMRMIDLMPRVRDFADLAGIIEHLDLVITIDTGVAHLAGAMGKPVWTLISYVPDFRWMLQRDDSPWYPTMRLYRQTSRSDWSAPIEQMAADLTGGAR